MKELRLMLMRTARHGRLILFAVILSTVQCGMELLLPRMMADIINCGVLPGALDYISAASWRMLAVCLTMGIAGYGANLLSAVAGRRFALDLRTEAYQCVTQMDVQQAGELGIGSLITRLTTDVNACADLVQAALLLVIEPIVLTIGGVWMMWLVSPVFGLIFVAFVTLQLVIMVFFIRATAPGFVKVRELMDAMNTRLQSAFTLFRLTKAANTQEEECARFSRLNEALFSQSYRVQRKIALFNPVIMLVMNLAVACILALSGWQVSRGTVNVGMVLMSITYSEQVLLSIMAGGQMYRLISETQPSAVRLHQVLLSRSSLEDGERRLEESFQELRFQQVSCALPDGTRVLEDLSFSIGAGEFVALIGPMGSGKSTLAGLCCRLYDPSGGTITLNGTELSGWRLEDVRRTVALVERQTVVFESTVLDNIVFGRDYVSREDARRAAQVAQLSDYLSAQSEGLDTSLLSYANRLSAGERQRLSIARAIAGGPGLLVLDDSTSALDYETERRFFRALRESCPNLALLLITNRMVSAQQADRIVLLEGGRIAAQGTAEQLRRESSLFSRIAAIQEGGGWSSGQTDP